ncbi:MAG: glycerol-3-phosphate 1-O-acyltransferase PlsY [Candidatus Aminicenantes bacterium]|nr:glycerol-3-phosphate 1-O-acyltransferase PlsY [Candidatus Aminicenantes bacterium]
MTILMSVIAYLFGAIPTGFVIYYLSEKKDIRQFGSGSTGATNVLRLKGWKYAVPVLVFDLLKGFLPVILSLLLFEDRRIALLSAFFAVLGHCFPVYIRFKGGKGVATTFGAFAPLAIGPVGIALSVFILTIMLTRYVSLGSLLATLSLIPTIFLLKGDSGLTGLAAVVFLVVCLRHTGNIKRLLTGKEQKFGKKNQ